MFRKRFQPIVLFLMGFIVFTVIGLAEDEYRPEVGETLNYQLFLRSAIHGANQTVSVVSRDERNERSVVRVEMEMTTVGMVGKLYPYLEKEELILDAEELFPYELRREVRAGRDLFIEEVEFDYERGVALRKVSGPKKGANKWQELELQGPVQDSLSLLFFLRRTLSPGEHRIFYYFEGVIKEITFYVAEKTRDVELDGRVYKDCVRINEPKSKIAVMIAKEEHLPVIVEQGTSFGKVEARLKDSF